jgi:hypothetical protein
MTALVTSWLVSYGAMTAGGTIAAFIVGWILKKIPTGKFSEWARKVGKAQGLAITTFFNAKFPKLWNGIIEPVVIDTLNAIGLAWLAGFIEGLRFDNKK